MAGGVAGGVQHLQATTNLEYLSVAEFFTHCHGCETTAG